MDKSQIELFQPEPQPNSEPQPIDTASATLAQNAMLVAGGKDVELLKRFMKEFFPYSEFRRAKIFTKEMKGDYYAQAYSICRFLGLKTIYEYGVEEVRFHCSYAEGKRPPGTPFIEVIESIYD